MQTSVTTITDKHRAYRRRLAANGSHQLVVALPRETVALLDELKERHGLRNRSQVLLQLIEQGRGAAQQTNRQTCESPPCRAGFCGNFVTGLGRTVGTNRRSQHSPETP